MPLCDRCNDIIPVERLERPLRGEFDYEVALFNDKKEGKQVYRPPQKGSSSEQYPDNYLYYLRDVHSASSFGSEHHHFAGLRKSAKTCPLCEVILHAVNRFENKKSNPHSTASQYGPNESHDRLRITTRRHSEMDYGYTLGKPKRPAEDGFAVFTMSNVLGALILLGEVGFAVDDSGTPDPLLDYFLGRVVHTDPKGAWNRPSHWISNCQHHHKSEHHPTKAQLPTRILDVGKQGGSDIKLHVPKKGDPHEFYTTLSYRWDPEESRHFKTTKQNISQHMKGIPMAKLPQNFRDAVDITRKLNIKYLWIDALCIIQVQVPGEHNPDWVEESPHMGDYYHKSYLTITASATEDSRKGIYASRNHAQFGPKFRYYVNDNLIGMVQAFLWREDLSLIRNSYTALRWEPLADRGWTFQERILSPRNLFYASDQIYYECSTEMVGENGFWMPGRLYSMGEKRNGLHAMLRDGSVNKHEVRRYWNQLMAMYGGLSLTFDSDKLPAVSGLATHFQRQLPNDEYCAGIWSGGLLDSLLWSSSESAGPWRDYRTMYSTRIDWPETSRSYRAPSWSWAAVRGVTGDFEYMQHYTRYARVVEYRMSVHDKGYPFGQVNKGHPGYVVLEAPFIPLVIESQESASHGKNKRDKRQTWFRVRPTATPDQLPVTNYLAFDYGIEHPRTLLLTAAIIGHFDWHDSYPALVLTPLEGGPPDTKRYTRVGYFEINRSALGSWNPSTAMRHKVDVY
jgi:hypothetical protein